MHCSPLLLLSDVPVSLKAHHRYILLLSLVIKQHSEERFSQNYNSGSTGGYETVFFTGADSCCSLLQPEHKITVSHVCGEVLQDETLSSWQEFGDLA